MTLLLIACLGRRGDEESDDEDLETQSVASYSSTPGTHSGEEGKRSEFFCVQHVTARRRELYLANCAYLSTLLLFVEVF